jgi:hypothetical protein
MAEMKEDEIVVHEASDNHGESFRILECTKPDELFYVATSDMAPGCLVLLQPKTKLGFAIPYALVHELSHMIHEALEQLNGGDIDDQETSDIEEKVTLH